MTFLQKEKSDIFSFGITLGMILTEGFHPYGNQENDPDDLNDFATYLKCAGGIQKKRPAMLAKLLPTYDGQ